MNKKILNSGVVVFVLIYVVIVACDMVCSSNELYAHLRYYTKPSILGALITFFLLQRKGLNVLTFRLMILALIFSLAGDILLLFVDRSQFFFIAGLIMFLLAHVMYILIFLRKRDNKKKVGFFLLLTVLYGMSLLYLLYPGLGNMLIPVIMYMVVILLMSNTAYFRGRDVSRVSYLLVFLGSLFFMLSDSLLAFAMFYKPIPLENVWIMVTYASAQFLIVYGVLEQKNNTLLK
ncbi:lysoplasmalogenase [Aquimarina sediminis]|uniref:lysoplasmalogenase n=1 Tax=Aquimarina sediminis TaxID=2070536 RepID=UPI0013E8CC55|nr:lysoplasmalogenase [Aquimarina sediminis]